MEKKRLGYIDFMKGVCIMLIVMHHTDANFYDYIAPNLNNTLQSFRIPMYYFLSGLFFKTYDGFNGFLRRKVNNLIVPFIFFHVGGFLVSAFTFHFIHPGSTFQWMEILAPLVHNKWSYTVALWFLLSLFEVNILYYTIKRCVKPTLLQAAIIALLSIVPLIMTRHSFTLPLMLDTALVGIAYFAIGAEVRAHRMLEPHKQDVWGAVIFLPVFFLIYQCAGYIDIRERVLPNYFQLYIIPAIAILTMLWACKNVRFYTHNTQSKRVTSVYARIPLVGYIGQFSLIVLGTHDLILTPLDAAFAGVEISAPAMALLKWSITIAAMFIIIPVLTALFPKFTAQKPLLHIS